jgi:hypothetical protein
VQHFEFSDPPPFIDLSCPKYCVEATAGTKKQTGYVGLPKGIKQYCLKEASTREGMKEN